MNLYIVESPFQLLCAVEARDYFQLKKQKSQLIIKFSKSKKSNLQLKQIVYDVNSPGKIFKLDESTIVSYLSEIEKSTRNKYSWFDTLGSRQLQRNSEKIDTEIFLKGYFNQ